MLGHHTGGHKAGQRAWDPSHSHKLLEASWPALTPSPALTWKTLREYDPVILISPTRPSGQAWMTPWHPAAKALFPVSGKHPSLLSPIFICFLLLYSLGPSKGIFHESRVNRVYSYSYLRPHGSFQVGRFLLRNISEHSILRPFQC